MFSSKHNDTKSESFWLGENKRNTMTVNERVVLKATVAQQEEHCFGNKNLNLQPVLHLYDLDPKSHLVKSELLLDKCFFKLRSASPIANYFLLNQKSSLFMSFVYLAYIYVFILKVMYLVSIKMNGRCLVSLPAIKLNYFCVFFFFLIKSPSDLQIAWSVKAQFQMNTFYHTTQTEIRSKVLVYS